LSENQGRGIAREIITEVESHSHSRKPIVPPHGVVTALVIITIRGQLKLRGKRSYITVGVIDQFGEVYCIKLLTTNTHNKMVPKNNLISCVINGIKKIFMVDKTTSISSEWQHQGKYENVDIIWNVNALNNPRTFHILTLSFFDNIGI